MIGEGNIPNKFEITPQPQLGYANKGDIQAILNVQNENSILNLSEDRTKEELEENGFLVHMLSEEELEGLLDNPEKVITLVYRSNDEIVGYAIGYDIDLWKDLNPDWESSIKFLEGYNISDIQDRVIYFRHVAKSLKASKGIGARLSVGLIKISKERGYKKMLAEILEEPYLNKPSMKLHTDQRIGFVKIAENNEEYQGEDYKWGLFKLVLDEK